MKYCKKCDQHKSLDAFNKNQRWCRSCQKAAKSKWNQENKERIKEYNAQYYPGYYEEHKEVIKANVSRNYQENREDKIAYANAYYEENKDEVLAKQAEYYKENKEVISVKAAKYRRTDKGKEIKRNCNGRRRARLKENGAEQFTYDDLRMFWLSQNILDDRCYYCLKPFSGKPEHIDHYIPIAKGGGHFKHNLRPSCTCCNLRKSDKHPIDFLKENN